MRISEIFYSLQGEGLLTGTPSVFIRTAGCPLRCKWCDTKYAWSPEAGREYSIEKILLTIQQWPCKHIVITGGEPMLSQDLPHLTSSLKSLDKHITIETAGIIYNTAVSCDLMSISPKLTNSTPDDPDLAKIHEDSRLDLAVIAELLANYDYQLKFVIDSENDLHEIIETIEQLNNVNLDRVMLMPLAQTRQQLLEKSPLIAELCKQTGYTFSTRLQIILWNNKKGT